MKYWTSRGFDKKLGKLPAAQRILVQRQVDAFVRAFETRQLPQGFGLKKLEEELWELRASLPLRVLFRWQKDAVVFLFLGDHDEVQRFLKHFLY